MTVTQQKRVDEIDFLKAILIILVVIFHLVWFSESHTFVKIAIYTFLMPAFLLLSGYFCHINKTPRIFLRQLLWFFIPYAIMEVGYTVMCFYLPIHEHITELSPTVLLYHLFVHPLGPYWYLQTLIICQLLCFVIFRLDLCRSFIGNLILLCVVIFALQDLIVFSKAMYFVAGFILLQSGTKFLSFFRPSFLSIIPLIYLCSFPQNQDRATVPGIAINYLAISFFLAIYPLLFQKIKKIFLFIGRNTLVIFLFSPIFTQLSKSFIPLFTWDPTRLSFMIVSVVFTIAGCIAITWIFDRFNISQFFFGRQQVLQ